MAANIAQICARGREINMTNLKAWRKERNLTQEKAAQALGITHRHYQRLEAGHSPIRETLEILIGKI